jgi:hypothetical protein
MFKYSVNDIVKKNIDNSFLVYPSTNNSSFSRNVFFVGSCRLAPIMFYFHLLYPQYNLYNIYVPHWSVTAGANQKHIQSILDNTDYIITETVRNCNIFNTEHSLPNNFFKTFNTTAQEIRICNLELHIYHYDLHNVFKIKDSEKHDWFIQSKNRLKLSLQSKQQNFIWQFIEDHLQSVRLFATQNHPTSILSIASFIFIAQQMNTKLDLSFLTQLKDHYFLEGHFTPILPIDIETYGFKFPCTIFPQETINDPDYRYIAPDSEKIISIQTLEKLLSYVS